MKFTPLSIPDVILIEPQRFSDERGFFEETFNKIAYEKLGIQEEFVQDNRSLSRDAYVIRGLHFQTPPYAQDKLVRVSRGSVLDVIVDIRRGSPTFSKHVSAIISAENGCQIWIPKGFAHGFCTLEPNTEFVYKVTEYYAADSDNGLFWADPELGIDWPIPDGMKPIVSERDERQPKLVDMPEYFKFVPN